MNVWQTPYAPSSILSYTQVIHVKTLHARYLILILQMKTPKSCVSRSRSRAKAAGLQFLCSYAGLLQLPRPGGRALRKQSRSREPETTPGESRDMRSDQKEQPIPGAGWLVQVWTKDRPCRPSVVRKARLVWKKPGTGARDQIAQKLGGLWGGDLGVYF